MSYSSSWSCPIRRNLSAVLFNLSRIRLGVVEGVGRASFPVGLRGGKYSPLPGCWVEFLSVILIRGFMLSPVIAGEGIGVRSSSATAVDFASEFGEPSVQGQPSSRFASTDCVSKTSRLKLSQTMVLGWSELLVNLSSGSPTKLALQSVLPVRSLSLLISSFWSLSWVERTTG